MELTPEEIDAVLKMRRNEGYRAMQWEVAREILKASLLAIDRLEAERLPVRHRATQGGCHDMAPYRRTCGESPRVRMVLGECGDYPLEDAQKILDQCRAYIKEHTCEE